MKKSISIIALGIFMSSFAIAQEAKNSPRNSRIASTTTTEESNESMFIEGITLEPVAEKKKTTNQVTAKKVTRPSVKADEIDEPAPTYKDKRTAKEILTADAKKNPTLYNFISSWYGTPYRMGGTTRRAIDCSAFTRQLFSDVYGKSLDRTAAMQFLMTKRVFSKDDLKEGDLVFFSIKTRRISHVGVYLGNGKFVHASSSQGVTISDLSQAYWTRYYAGGGRF